MTMCRPQVHVPKPGNYDNCRQQPGPPLHNFMPFNLPYSFFHIFYHSMSSFPFKAR